MRRLDLTDPRPPNEEVKLFATLGGEEDWGELEPFRGSSWAHGVTVVTAESMSHALHGMLLPLLRELGRDPRASAKRVSDAEGQCGNLEACPIANKYLCRPGGRKRREHGPPGCYEPPLETGTPVELRDLFYKVSQAWKDGRHTVVIVGEGFNLK